MKNIIRTILTSFILFNTMIIFASWNPDDIRSNILPKVTGGPIEVGETEIDSSNSLLNNIINYISESIFNLIMIISIAVFIFIWAKLITAKWNPEEFKKAIMSFIYAIAWIFIVSASLWVVKLVASLNL